MSNSRFQTPNDSMKQLYDRLMIKHNACVNYHDIMLQAAQFEVDELNSDTNPAFIAFFEHLAGCIDCAEEYTNLVDILREYTIASALIVLQRQRTFFTKPVPTAERKDSKKWLKLRQSTKRQLELTIPAITLQQMVPTMATTTLYNSQLTELVGKPFFIISLVDTQNLPILKVMLREPQIKQWQVTVQTQQRRYSQTANSQGMTEFNTIPAVELSQGIVLTFDEL